MEVSGTGAPERRYDILSCDPVTCQVSLIHMCMGAATVPIVLKMLIGYLTATRRLLKDVVRTRSTYVTVHLSFANSLTARY